MTIDPDAYKKLPSFEALEKHQKHIEVERNNMTLPPINHIGHLGFPFAVMEDYASPMLKNIEDMQRLPFWDDNTNKRFAKNVMSENRKLVQKDMEGRDIFLAGSPALEAFIFAYNPKTQMIDYACRFQAISNPIFKKAAVQTMVWKRPGPELKTIVKDIMLTLLVGNYGTIVSDDTHTSQGKDMWMKVLKQAFNQGYEVGFINLKGGIKRTAKDIDGFIKKYSQSAYSNSDTHKQYRFYVSKK